MLGGLACNQGSDIDASAPNTTTTSNSAAKPAAPPAAATTKDISGVYTITGQNEGGGGNYTGDLTVTKRDEVYQF